MNTLLALSIAIAAGLAVSRLARLVRLPNVTAFLVGGLIIGPSVLGILPRDMLDGFSVITEAALGFIAYSIGAEFKMSYLKRIGAKPLTITVFEGLGAVVLVDVVLIGCSLAGIPGFDLPMCVALGAIAAATALDDLGISSGRSTGGTTRFFVSDTPDGFAKQERLFMGSEAGGPVEQIAIETY